jgi:DNA replication and repair protein RecF
MFRAGPPVRVDRFACVNYRNLADGEVEFGPGLNLIVGANGQGKSNLLEGIYFFRFGRSFRAPQEIELIRFGAPFCRVEASASFVDGRHERFAVSIEERGERARRTLKIDGRAIARRADLAGRFPAVLFGPHDLRIAAGEPEHRRRFLDMVGTMTHPGYLRAAVAYRRVVEQRNAALKARASRQEIEAWNERLVETGGEFTLRRLHLTAAIDREMRRHARELPSPFDFSMAYRSALPAEEGEAAVTAAFRDRLAAVAAEELRRGVTLAGPHRDDVALVMDGSDLRRFGSQGQRRLLAVLLKLSEMSYLEGELREPCALLLDDVLAEFDDALMAKLQRLLDGTRQVFVTSPVPIASPARARVWRVDAGRVTPAGEAPGAH